MSVEDPSIWKQAANWLWAILIPMLAVIWGLLSKRIDKIEAKADSALPRSEFKEHLEHSMKDRQNLREDVKELFNKTEALKDQVNARMETLRTDMHEAIGRLGDKMEKGFRDLRGEMLEAIRNINRNRKGDS